MRTTIQVVVCFSISAAVFAASGSTALAQQGRRPFENFRPAPTTSPYLRLLNNNGTGTGGITPDYQSFVLPQLQQQEFQRQTTRDISNLQVGQARQAATIREGNVQLRPTGHRANMQYYSHFYPTYGARR